MSAESELGVGVLIHPLPSNGKLLESGLDEQKILICALSSVVL